MKPTLLKLALLITGSVLFNLIFWQEKFALNAVIFDLFVIGSVFFLYKLPALQVEIKWLLVAHAITIITLLLHNTILSKLAFSITLIVLVIFVQFIHRSIWYAAGTALCNYLMVIPSVYQLIKIHKWSGSGFFRLFKHFRLLFIPLVLFFVFFIMYNISNVVFLHFFETILIRVAAFVSNLIEWMLAERMMFLLLGCLITGGLILKSNSTYFSSKDINHKNELLRTKNKPAHWRESIMYDILRLIMGKTANGNLGLQKENITGILSLVFLNALLLVVNCIDIKYVWLGFQFSANKNLSAYVHEGAGMLIFSIFIAMAVLLFFFRGNLNFYTKNKYLKIGAYAWVAQNIVLVISVFIRDYYYIAHYGLAYKRLGVLVFLLLVLFGLITIVIKISQLKTIYYLMRVNAWFVIIMLVTASCIHWDETIASYNLSRKSTIQLDINFLVSLSDKTLPLLQQNIHLLKENEIELKNSNNDNFRTNHKSALQKFEERKVEFISSQLQYSWLSWNYADANTRKKLTQPAISSLIVK